MIDELRLIRKSPTPNGKQKDSFQMFYSMADSAVTILKEPKLIGMWFQATLNYELYGDQPTFEDAEEVERAVLQAVFTLSAQQLDAAFSAWCQKCLTNAGNRSGSNGALP